MKRTLSQQRALVLVLIGHTIVATVTWRDIRRRPAQQVRGSKTFWRIASAVNTLGSAGYWLLGRRYTTGPGHGRRAKRAHPRRGAR
jgi:hypothetical protein